MLRKSDSAGWVLNRGWWIKFYKNISITFIRFSKWEASVAFTFLKIVHINYIFFSGIGGIKWQGYVLCNTSLNHLKSENRLHTTQPIGWVTILNAPYPVENNPSDLVIYSFIMISTFCNILLVYLEGIFHHIVNEFCSLRSFTINFSPEVYFIYLFGHLELFWLSLWGLFLNLLYFLNLFNWSLRGLFLLNNRLSHLK